MIVRNIGKWSINVQHIPVFRYFAFEKAVDDIFDVDYRRAILIYFRFAIKMRGIKQ
jgi:hypothetical protein